MRIHTTTLFTATCLAALVAPALADGTDAWKNARPTPQAQVPAPPSDDDPAPFVVPPGVEFPDPTIIEQAGTDGDVGYGRTGVLELGASAGLMIASGFRNVSFAPTFGWFVADNVELSAILGVTNIKAGEESATVFSALVEPSYSIPYTHSIFGFVGMGLGAAYVSELGGGLAVAPRIGAKFRVGRSGVLSPSLSYEYTSHNVETVDEEMGPDVALAAVSSAVRINIGYTAMW